MKRLLFYTILFLASQTHTHETGNAEALQPNITAEQRWQEYEARRLRHHSFGEKLSEFFYEWKESFKHSFLIDILFCKNNRIETPLCKEVLEKFDRDLSNVTVLHKPMPGPACAIFNTIILDHNKMSKFTSEEQAFILGHELVHLKNKDWVQRILFNLAIDLGGLFLLGKITPKEFTLITWIFAQLYLLIPAKLFLSRFQEKRCDITSAKTLGLAHAGASAFEKMRKKFVLQEEAPMNPNGIWHNIQTFFGLYLSHPELHDRGEYLLELAKEQELTA